jgi:hypothetical protein
MSTIATPADRATATMPEPPPTLAECAYANRSQAAPRRPRPSDERSDVSLCLAEAGIRARIFLRAHRHGVQRDLAAIGALKGRCAKLPAQRARGSRGSGRPAARRSSPPTRGSPDDEPGEADPVYGRAA